MRVFKMVKKRLKITLKVLEAVKSGEEGFYWRFYGTRMSSRKNICGWGNFFLQV